MLWQIRPVIQEDGGHTKKKKGVCSKINYMRVVQTK